MKKLFWKDKTGRGFSNMLTFEDILDLENEEDWNGELLHEWVEECEPGDRWDFSEQNHKICNPKLFKKLNVGS